MKKKAGENSLPATLLEEMIRTGNSIREALKSSTWCPN